MRLIAVLLFVACASAYTFSMNFTYPDAKTTLEYPEPFTAHLTVTYHGSGQRFAKVYVFRHTVEGHDMRIYTMNENFDFEPWCQYQSSDWYSGNPQLKFSGDLYDQFDLAWGHGDQFFFQVRLRDDDTSFVNSPIFRIIGLDEHHQRSSKAVLDMFRRSADIISQKFFGKKQPACMDETIVRNQSEATFNVFETALKQFKSMQFDDMALWKQNVKALFATMKPAAQALDAASGAQCNLPFAKYLWPKYADVLDQDPSKGSIAFLRQSMRQFFLMYDHAQFDGAGVKFGEQLYILMRLFVEPTWDPTNPDPFHPDL